MLTFLFITLHSPMRRSPSDVVLDEGSSSTHTQRPSASPSIMTMSPTPEAAADNFGLSHSHVAELSEAFRMLLFCTSATSGLPVSGNTANDETATMTATIANIAHHHTAQDPPPAIISPRSAVSSPTPASHSGQGNATVVNSITTEQLNALLHSLGLTNHQHGSGITSPGTPAGMKRVASFRQFSEVTDPVASALKVIEDDLGGKISFTDFLHLMLRQSDPNEIEEMRSAFRFYDRNNTGLISVNQFVEMFASMGDKSSPEEIDEMLALADPDSSGKIDYNAFLTHLAKSL